MDFAAFLAIAQKVASVLGILIAAAQDVEPVLKAFTNLIMGVKNGTVTQAQVDDLEKQLDDAIAEFNAEI